MQATRKTREGTSHPDCNAQFEPINARVKDFQQRGQPVGSADTKKKEGVGDFANGGREYQPKESPERVRVYDFIDKHVGKAIPYGVYDITQNCGWLSVGVDHDTAEFAVSLAGRERKSTREPQQNTVTSPLMAPSSKSGVRVLYSLHGPESYSINYQGRKVYGAADEGLGPWRGLSKYNAMSMYIYAIESGEERV